MPSRSKPVAKPHDARQRHAAAAPSQPGHAYARGGARLGDDTGCRGVATRRDVEPAGLGAPAAATTGQTERPPRAVTLDLVPGVALGPFRLGVGVTPLLDQLTADFATFPRCKIVFDDDQGAPSDILVEIPDVGVCLRFEHVTQQLRRIDFWPSDFLTVTYKGRVVLKPQTPTRFQTARDLFGPTAGEYDRASRCYVLRYPGVTLGFGAVSHTEANPGGDDPDTPLRCASVLSGLDAKASPPPAAPPIRVRAIPGVGLHLEDGRKVSFDDSCQDVVQTLGPPCSEFRPVDSAWIGGDASEHGDQDRGAGAGVFLNYRRLGLDVFFDPRRLRVAKFVMHANVPGHYDFGQYTKCNFVCEIRATSGSGTSIMHGAAARADPQADALLRSCIDAQPGRLGGEVVDDGDSFQTLSDTLSAAWDSGSNDSLNSTDSAPPVGGDRGRMRSSSSILVTPETKWPTVIRQFKLSKPVSMQPPPAPNTINPFGPTHLYNDDVFVFEVVPSGLIATVTLFEHRDSL